MDRFSKGNKEGEHRVRCSPSLSVRFLRLQVRGDQTQLLCGGLGLAAAADAELFQNVAHMGLDGGELYVHDPRDLSVALVSAEEGQNLPLRGGQRLAGGEARLQESGIVGRLRGNCR